MILWRLRSGLDRRFRSGHPWVYSNELQESPKGIEPGALVELRDPGGKFLARGYGNPASLIAFRALTRESSAEDPFSAEFLLGRLERAAQLRRRLGFETSFRLCFGEADDLPGLVIDRYCLASGGQVFSIQAHTAGANRMLATVSELLPRLSEKMKWGTADQTGLVLRNDLNVRKLEGLEVEEPRILRGLASQSLEHTTILTGSLASPVEFDLDLIGGQKTGFFLDQHANVSLALSLIGADMEASSIRVLDLCCYVGQWGARICRVLAGKKVLVTGVDASAAALQFAKKNVERAGGEFETFKGDALRDLVHLPPSQYDIVICDPPALIKNRKDIGVGTHAYLQLNTEALRLVKPMGFVVSCSCSGLLEEESFRQVLAKASQRNRRKVRWVSRGAQSPDHPLLAEFPEGRYLKSWMGRVD